MTRRYEPAPIRFFRKVRPSYLGCWIWIGGKDRGGYGTFRDERGYRYLNAHKWAWEYIMGPMVEGLELDHLCRNRACVNPLHLEPVTHRENTARGIGTSAVNARKTHCKHGHEFTPENTIVRNRGDGRGRVCRACAGDAARRYRERQRALAQ